MHAIVSLLDGPGDHLTRALWAELDERRGLRAVTQRVPYPHFSYHGAEDYDLTRVAEALGVAASEAGAYTASIEGLGAFFAPEPVLYLKVARTEGMDRLHAALWRELERTGAARGVSPFYTADQWQPHITLAQGDLTLETLRAILDEWAGRDLRQPLAVSDLTLLYREADQWQPRIQRPLGAYSN